jgi:hypothetical protein
MLAAVVADDLEALWRVLAKRSLLSAAFCTALRRHHVALVIKFLVLFGKEKDLLALYAWDLYIGHR